jgi:hypothetical protein
MDLEKKNQYTINVIRESNSVKEDRRIIEKISDLLSDICQENKKESNLFSNPLKCFYTRNIPLISIKDYLEHIYKYTKINSSTIVLILIYIDRICNIHKGKLSYYNIHKLILGSMIIAIKYNEDEYYSMKFYAKIGGVTLVELCNLEYNFLSLINYNLMVNDDLFHKYNDYILSSDSEEDDSDNLNYDDNNEDDNN